MNLFQSSTALIGRTPLLALRSFDLPCRLVAKLEFFNPLGSVKDRAAWWMIESAEREGKLSPGGVVIEATSGNTGIGLSWICATRGYRLLLTMPENMSEERRSLLAALGAELFLTPAAEGMAGANKKAQELAASLPGSFLPMQFENPANAEVHMLTTGPELWEDSGGKLDILVAAVGSGGTITGTGRFLKEKKPAIKIIGVEPAGSPVLSGGKPGPHNIAGIGAGFVPKVLDPTLLDEVLPVTDEDAFAMTRQLVRQEGLFCGISSGAAVHAAVQVGGRPDSAGKTIAVILPDTGDRYLSTGVFDTEK